MTQAPAAIRRSGALTGRLLGAGIPLGPNVLLTIRGRTSGRPRTVPVALVELDGRRWVVGTYGDVQWTRNLRAAGEAELRLGDRVEHVTARELSHEEAIELIRDTLPRYVASLPGMWRFFSNMLLRTVATDMARDPQAAAARRPIFELQETMAAKEAP
ncbi:MAG TPA: nitroreductase family deazaflavin-dependent oxidoreductase [Candidatus Limnocylindrales bacterium]|nr:nitroreductase family deazaflavin-dependent oxidoreductase [Candidatus Limnocylindrales bacterium]